MLKNPSEHRLSGLINLPEKRKENLFTAIYAGSLLISLAIIYAVHLPNNLWEEFINFFTSLTLSPIGGGVALPAPANPAAHIELYTAAFQFALALSMVEIVILTLRILLHSPVKRKGETVENVVFWLGTSYLTVTYLVNMTIPAEWFIFWSAEIAMFGLALIARSFVLLAAKY